MYLPADQKGLVQAFFQKYQPKILILVETELWPNLIDQAQAFKVSTILVNARLSAKSAQGYAKVSGLTQAMLKGLNQLLAQDAATAERFIQLGAAPSVTQVVGSIKFDIHAPEQFVQQAIQLKHDWQLADRKIITIASTHAPEEQKLLSALQPYLQQHPELLCIVVPRHPERFDEVYQIAQNLNLQTNRRSQQQPIQADTQVFLADSMGELWLWYALSQVCFVGGSLNEPGGGHNILEPIALNVPTILGKNYFNFQTIVDEFIQADAVKVVENAEQAATVLMQLLENTEQAQQLNLAAQKIMQLNKGSLDKHIQAIDGYL